MGVHLMAADPSRIALAELPGHVRCTACESSPGAPGCRAVREWAVSMRKAGVDIITDYSEVAVVGITEIVGIFPLWFAP